MAEKNTTLVMTPTGKVGKRLIPMLTRRGVMVRAASRNPVGARPGIEPVRFDWYDESTYEAARRGVNSIYVVAGPSPQPEHAEYISALLDGADGVKRVVLMSVFGVEDAPDDNPFRRIELAVENSGIPFTILRPGAFMQNLSENHFTNASSSIRERDEIAMPGGEGRVSWLSAEDIAAVAAVALTESGHEGKGYALLGPEPLTMAEIVDQISWVIGRRIRYVETDHTPIRDALIASGVPPETAENNSRLAAFAFSSGAFGGLNDNILNVTGREPVTFAEFAVNAAPAWRRS